MGHIETTEQRNVTFFVKIADKKKAIKEIKKEVKALKIQVKESKDDKTRKQVENMTDRNLFTYRAFNYLPFYMQPESYFKYAVPDFGQPAFGRALADTEASRRTPEINLWYPGNL